MAHCWCTRQNNIERRIVPFHAFPRFHVRHAAAWPTSWRSWDSDYLQTRPFEEVSWCDLAPPPPGDVSALFPYAFFWDGRCLFNDVKTPRWENSTTKSHPKLLKYQFLDLFGLDTYLSSTNYSVTKTYYSITKMYYSSTKDYSITNTYYSWTIKCYSSTNDYSTTKKKCSGTKPYDSSTNNYSITKTGYSKTKRDLNQTKTWTALTQVPVASSKKRGCWLNT